MLPRTIHGMVYNAMKLFMEVNPGLFDECSHEYTEQQKNLDTVKANRQAKWDRLTQMAESMKTSVNGTHTSSTRAPGSGYNSTKGSQATSPMRQDDVDPMSQESQQRMERLRLQDDRERRPKDAERQSNSVR